MSLLESTLVYKPFQYPWAYDAWLQQQRIHWLPEEVPLGEDVKEWQKSLTEAERYLLTQIFRLFTQMDVEVQNCYNSIYARVFRPTEVVMMLTAFSNIECFDRQTELLTNQGWKYVDQLTVEDRVAQFDLSTKEISFVHPDRVVSYPYKGIMHSYENRSTSICVTPNHDLIVGNPRTGTAFKAKSMDHNWDGNWLYPTTGRRANFPADIPAIHRLLIATAADGCIRADCPSNEGKDHRTVDFNLHKEHKIGRLMNILALLNQSVNWRLNGVGGMRATFAIPGDHSLHDLKSLDFIPLEGTTPEIAAGYLREILNWDGVHNNDNLKSFYSVNKSAVDKVQALSVICGLSAIVGVNGQSGREVVLPNGSVTTNTQTCYVVTISERSWRSFPGATNVEYDDHVFCVSVPTQNIVSRRNGRVAITGNTVHVGSYSHLLDTIGMPEIEYAAFLQYKEMKDKCDYLHNFNSNNKHEIAKTLAVFGGFTEGVQLFASFAVLLNFPRHNKMKGMGQIITLSVRDESLHCECISKLFRTFIQENPEIWTDQLRSEIYQAARDMITNEDKFIELCFAMGPLERLTADEVKLYIRYITDRRLQGLMLDPIYNISKNPLPWLDEMLNAVEHVNFFENRSTEYSKASTTGTWDEAFEGMTVTPFEETA